MWKSNEPKRGRNLKVVCALSLHRPTHTINRTTALGGHDTCLTLAIGFGNGSAKSTDKSETPSETHMKQV